MFPMVENQSFLQEREKERKKSEWFPKVRQVINLSITIARHTALKGTELPPWVAHATH